MNQPAFDTLRTTQQMEDAGIARAHAEAISHAFAEWGEKLASKEDLKGLATKEDMIAVKTELRSLRRVLYYLLGPLLAAMLVGIMGLVGVVVHFYLASL